MGYDQRALSDTTPPVPIAEVLAKYGIVAHYRPGTSDERVLREVLFTSPYRRKRLGFDVEPGEHWLDLGANIGAFAIYCRERRATAHCFEPDRSSFDVLVQNATGFGFRCERAAVTAKWDAELEFWTSKAQTDHHRGTTFPMKMAPKHPDGTVPNVHGSLLMQNTYTGVKMDVEGTEGELLDAHLIPTCAKLVVEYHLWRDPSMDNLRRRLDYLRSRFRTVSYPPEFDRMLANGFKENTSYYDRLIFCMR